MRDEKRNMDFSFLVALCSQQKYSQHAAGEGSSAKCRSFFDEQWVPSARQRCETYIIDINKAE
jgi:hypothetical protein